MADDIMDKRIARCSLCASNIEASSTPSFGVMKPDIVFFGESLPELFYSSLEADLPKVHGSRPRFALLSLNLVLTGWMIQADLMLVIGTSLRVAPVSEILPQLPPSIPVILINRELVGQPHCFDVELLGDSDVVVEHLSRMLDEESVETARLERHEGDTGGKTTESCSITPSVASDPGQAAEIVASGGVVRWLPRPSTFLFSGFALPQSCLSQDPSSAASDLGSDRGGEEDGIDEDGIDSDSASLHLENLDGDEGSTLNGLVADSVGQYANASSDSSEYGTFCEEESVRYLGSSTGDVGVQDKLVDEHVTLVTANTQQEINDAASGACEAIGGGVCYDSSWGIQRQRPETSIMASFRRPG